MNSSSSHAPTGYWYSPAFSNPQAAYSFCAFTFPLHTPIQSGPSELASIQSSAIASNRVPSPSPCADFATYSRRSSAWLGFASGWGRVFGPVLAKASSSPSRSATHQAAPGSRSFARIASALKLASRKTFRSSAG